MYAEFSRASTIYYDAATCNTGPASFVVQYLNLDKGHYYIPWMQYFYIKGPMQSFNLSHIHCNYPHFYAYGLKVSSSEGHFALTNWTFV